MKDWIFFIAFSILLTGVIIVTPEVGPSITRQTMPGRLSAIRRGIFFFEWTKMLGFVQETHDHPGKLLGHLINDGNHTSLNDRSLTPFDGFRQGLHSWKRKRIF